MNGHEFNLDVVPAVPDEIARLSELANDLWYSWHRPARALFGSLDAELWGRVGHSPKLFLSRVDERLLAHAANDEVFLSNYHQVLAAYDTYRARRDIKRDGGALDDTDLIAYFCAEYGLHESLPIYSGGLGILAGHHCKSASDLRLPFVAVGLLYQAGYFAQQIDDEGNQIADYVESSFDNLPVTEVRGEDGAPLTVGIPFPGRDVVARVWRVRAGHVDIYLLDTNVPANNDADRLITWQLYGGDKETRIAQELVLGIGGVKALRTLGLAPTVWHLNEGHAAFLILERVRELVATGEDFASALEYVAASCVFTTHTPVPAGHDYFPVGMVEAYLAPLRELLAISAEDLLGLGGAGQRDRDFNMTTLAITGSRYYNGVSRIHGMVSAALAAGSWPHVPPEENPIGYITNGVHVPTVLSQEWCDLFDRYLGVDWRNHLSNREYWQGIHEIPDHLFWSVSQSIKSRMLRSVREMLIRQHSRNQVSEPHLERMLEFIDPGDPNVLTIGFARRFATYKRAALLFNDLAWLRDLVSHEERPVVFIFSGKAHPADNPGQQLIRTIHEVSNTPGFVGKVLLVEGYDLGIARRFVAGVDVWLNNPVYAMEASGTSGMKAAVNGTINLSVTDGWWAEGFESDNGWAIRPSPHRDDDARRDAEDARTLYEILQDDVIPLYCDRGKYGYSEGWVHMAKRSMASVLPRFNMSRVVNEYTTRLYEPAARTGKALADGEFAGARTLAQWKARVRGAWPALGLRLTHAPRSRVRFGESVSLTVAAELNGLQPEDVVIEALVSYQSDPDEPVARGNAPEDMRSSVTRRAEEPSFTRLALHHARQRDDTLEHDFVLELVPRTCGRLSYRIRMYAYHRLLAHPFEMGLMQWL